MLLFVSVLALGQEVPHGDFESVGNLTGWTVVLGTASDAVELQSTIRNSRVMEVDRGGGRLVVCSSPFVVTRGTLAALMHAPSIGSNDETDWWIEPAAGGLAWAQAEEQPDDSNNPYSRHTLDVATACGQAARVCIEPKQNETIDYDDFVLEGPPCPAYVDGDGDGYCEQGLDANSDGNCADVGEFDAPFSDCDDADIDRSPGLPEVCNGIDDDCDNEVDEGFDVDGDSYTTCNGDCDDNQPGIYPGAQEQCNGRDDDCDGRDDEDFDVDRDGVTTCDGDCDDDDVNVHPGASEQCNNRDDDCDNDVDEGVVWVDWYPDDDEDGFGDMNAAPVYDCRAPRNTVDNGLDCDDADDSVYPGAPDEPGDGRDTDCDGGTGPDTGGVEGARVAHQVGCGCRVSGMGGLTAGTLILAAFVLGRRPRPAHWRVKGGTHCLGKRWRIPW